MDDAYDTSVDGEESAQDSKTDVDDEEEEEDEESRLGNDDDEEQVEGRLHMYLSQDSCSTLVHSADTLDEDNLTFTTPSPPSTCSSNSVMYPMPRGKTKLAGVSDSFSMLRRSKLSVKADYPKVLPQEHDAHCDGKLPSSPLISSLFSTSDDVLYFPLHTEQGLRDSFLLVWYVSDPGVVV
jgi:hypothetical protein